MKIVVDYDLCQGHGMCEGEAPEVFQVDEAGQLTVLAAEPAEAQHDAVNAAVRYCPQQAISTTD